MEMTKKEEKKSELEKELVYKPIYLPVRFFRKEAYIHIDDYKEAINKRENAVNGLEEENKKLKENYKVLGILNDEIRRVNENLREDNKKLKEDVDYFRQCYLDLKKLCEKEGFMLSDEEVTKMFDLDRIK